MCGIFGQILPGKPVDRACGVKATNLMRHRGPDDEGYLFASLARQEAALAAGDETKGLHLPLWHDESTMPGADVMFGFRRLSIHDLTEAGHQPMGTPDGKLWIVFNGEVYNFIELRAELEALGVSFVSGTDTEVILRGYERWGPRCLERFNGMWGLAVLDLRASGSPKLFLARDRCGVKPLFYQLSGADISFASEVKALLSLNKGLRHINRTLFADFLAWGRYPGAEEGETFFEGIRMLPPGYCAEWTPAGFSTRKWWTLGADGDGSDLAEDEAIDRLRCLVDDAVRLRLRADVPLGSCLSGGLDSSLIVGSVSRLLGGGGRQRTFSAIYDTAGPFNEERFVKRVVGAIAAESFYCKPSASGLVKDFDRLVWQQEEPFTTTSIYAQWCVMRLADESGTRVLLDGQAADELFGGYRPYRWHFAEMIRHGQISGVLREAQLIRRETGDSPWRALCSALPVGLLPPQLVTAAVRIGYLRALGREADRILLPPDRARLLERVATAPGTASYPWRRAADSIDQHLRGLTLDFVLPNLLRFEDRNSMAFSVESRVPFTDYRLVEYAFSPAMRNLKLRNGWAKWALRKAGDGLVPDDILWRRDKIGFATPEQDLVLALARASGMKYPDALIERGLVDPQGARRTMFGLNQSSDKSEQLRAFRIMVAGSWASQFDAA